MMRLTVRRVIVPALVAGILSGVLAGGLAGCGVSTVPLMPTPVIFTECDFDPMDHVPEAERFIPRRVYYATSRVRTGGLQRIDYGNTPSADITLGLTLIGFGNERLSWSDLSDASRAAERERVVPLAIAGIMEAGVIEAGATLDEAAAPGQAGWVLNDMNKSIAEARDKDILIYVHGAKVNFYNACAYAAQLDHFTGRDMTSMAFSWPTRQNIFAYAFGSDIERGREASKSLATVIELLANETEARRIHILCWSAGARVTTDMFLALRERHPDMPLEALRERLRIGTAYFAAGDVTRDYFIPALETIHGLSDRVIVSATDNDIALKTGGRVMGGGTRIGQTGGEVTDEQRAMVESLDRIEIINVSAGADVRGFDIVGHRYWLDHPWASTDVLLALRTDHTAAERGLVRREESPIVWYVPEDYPQRLCRILGEFNFKRWSAEGVTSETR